MPWRVDSPSFEGVQFHLSEKKVCDALIQAHAIDFLRQGHTVTRAFDGVKLADRPDFFRTPGDGRGSLISLSANKMSLPDLVAKQGQNGCGRSPCALSRADIRRLASAGLPASRRYSPRQAEYPAS
jgi:hypothetical protein